MSAVKRQTTEDPLFRPEAVLPRIFHQPLSSAGLHWRETIAKEEILARIEDCWREWRVAAAMEQLGETPEVALALKVADCPFTEGFVVDDDEVMGQGGRKCTLQGSGVLFLSAVTSKPPQTTVHFFLSESDGSTPSVAMARCDINGQITAGIAVSGDYADDDFLVSDVSPSILSQLPVFNLFTGDPDDATSTFAAVKQNLGPRRSDGLLRTYQEFSKQPTGPLTMLQSKRLVRCSRSSASELYLDGDDVTINGLVALEFNSGILEVEDATISLESGAGKILENCLLNSKVIPESLKAAFERC